MKKKKEKEEELFFVKLSDPYNLRRKILESSKEVLESLTRYENLKSIRKEKLDNISQLKDDVKEMLSLISKLKSELPKIDLRVKEEKPVVIKKKGIIEEVEKPKEKTDLEKLESELKDIENRLNAVS